MGYEETKELERNVEISKKAEKICADFKANISLSMKGYIGNGLFVIWSDSHNKIRVDVSGASPVFQCRFLHESYDIRVSPDDVFEAIKKGCRGVDHLRAYTRKSN